MHAHNGFEHKDTIFLLNIVDSRDVHSNLMSMSRQPCLAEQTIIGNKET